VARTEREEGGGGRRREEEGGGGSGIMRGNTRTDGERDEDELWTGPLLC